MLDITLGFPRRYEALTVFPLLAERGARLELELMPDAISAGTLLITEVGQGSVPELLARNSGGGDVLVLDGEQLIGARQNRTTNRSIVLPAGSEVKIPVSCMEQGRWHHVSPDFQPHHYNSPSKVRRHARRTEADHADSGAEPSAHVLREAQGKVWSEIASTCDSMGVRSGTGALDEAYRQRAVDLEAWARAFPWEDRQVGLLALLGRAPLGLDVIGDAGLYEQIHPRLVMGYAMDALSEPARDEAADPRAAEEYLAAARSARRTPAPTPGKGTYQVLSGAVVGAELADGGRLVHLSAFPGSAGGRDPGGVRHYGAPLRPPSRRRGPAE